MRARSMAPALAALAVAVATTGCVFFTPPDPGFGTATATFATGRATLTIGDEQIVLDQIAPGPHFMADFGPEVYWFNEDGWGLRLMGGGTGVLGPGPFGGAMISIDRVRTTYWSASDYGSACKVKMAEADADGVRGTATCTGLRWSDMLRGGMGGLTGDGYVDGEPPFDATIEFSALPAAPGA